VILYTVFSTDSTFTGLGDGVKTSLIADVVIINYFHTQTNIPSANVKLQTKKLVTMNEISDGIQSRF
jgi:hypothetical protein